MEIYIKGHDAIQGLLKEQYRKFDVILYTNSDYPVPRYIETHCKEMLHLAIDDVEFPRKYQVAPSMESVQKVLDWSKGRDKLICCCHAGISRSSAAAYIIAARELGAKKGLDILQPQRHFPNRLIVQYGSKILNDPLIWEMFIEWEEKNI